MNQYDGDTANEATGPPQVVTAQPEGMRASLLHVLWRRRWVIALTTAASVAAALIYLTRATPLYTSTSRLYVERKGPRIITESEGVMTQAWNYVYTQAELVKSTPIVASALDQPGMRRMSTLRQVSNPVGYLKSALKVAVGKKDDIISVSFESPYPEEAAQIVNSVVDAYVTYHAKQKRNTAAEVLKILQKEKTKRDAELAEKLRAMLEFRQADPGLGFESNKGNIILDRLARLSDALNTAQLETIDAQAACEAARAMARDPAKAKQLVEARRASGGSSFAVSEEARLRAQLEHLHLRSLELKRQFTRSHPAVQAVESKKADLERRLAELEKKSVEAELAVAAQRLHRAKEREDQIRRFFEEQRDKAQGLNAQLAQYTILQSDWQQTKKLCEILDDRIKEINVTEDTGALNITVLEVARPQSAPSSPKKTRVMAVALVLGLMLGLGLALARDWMDHRIRSADEISAALGVPVLGVVPAMRHRESIEVHGRKVESDPKSHAAEAYRTIRTAIYFGVPDGEARTLLVTSPAPGDGKTTLVSNLAIAMAQAGQRTLVLDADFRKPMQHRVFEIEQDHGLSGALAGRAALEDAIHHTALEGLDVLPCGPVPPNPSEMLNSRAFRDLLKKASKSYDHILIDSPPVMPVADARILGATSDVTLIVLRAEKSHRKAAERARDGLLSVGAKILGAVVNAVPRSQDRYYYTGCGYPRYRYPYGYGYGGHRKGRDQEGQAKSGDVEREQVAAAGSEGAE